jgi:hypothetical protein
MKEIKMLSPKVKEEMLEAQSHIRAALKNAAVNEKPFVCKHLADILQSLDTLEHTENMLDMLENRKPGSSGSFGTFFNE